MPRIVVLDQTCTKPRVFPEEGNGDVVSYHEGDLTICADNLHFYRAIPQAERQTNRRATRPTTSPGNTEVVEYDTTVSDKGVHRPFGIGDKSTFDEESTSESGDDEQIIEPPASTAAIATHNEGAGAAGSTPQASSGGTQENAAKAASSSDSSSSSSDSSSSSSKPPCPMANVSFVAEQVSKWIIINTYVWLHSWLTNPQQN